MISTKTPCVGICSTSIGGPVCHGCKRYVHEVINWNTYTDRQKQVVNERLQTFLVQAVGAYVEALNAQRLQSYLTAKKIAYVGDDHPYLWFYALLKTEEGHMQDLPVDCVQFKAGYRNVPLKQLKETIDEAFFELSEAYYQRYFEDSLRQR